MGDDHVQVVGEVLQGVPLVVNLERRPNALTPGKSGSATSQPCHLLAPVGDELAADHLDVGVDLVPLAVEGVGGAVHADEPLAAVDRVEEGLLAVLRHRRRLVGPRGRQVERRLEGEGVPLADLVRGRTAGRPSRRPPRTRDPCPTSVRMRSAMLS
jgi:hypothetical protein